MKKVSIIVPVYNVEPYIKRCLHSIMAQKYTNIECILVDDCSTDNSLAIIKETLLYYMGPIIFIIIHHNRNRGLSAARNTGTNSATGEWIFYLDSDDTINNNTIFLLISASISHPGIEMVIGNAKSDINHLHKFDHYPFLISNNFSVRQMYFNPEFKIPVFAWNKLISKQFINNNNLSFEEGICFEDELWMFFAIKHINKILFINDITYTYYNNPKSIMNTINEEKSSYNWSIILNKMLDSIDKPCQQLQLVYISNRFVSLGFKFINNNKNKSLYKKLRRMLFINKLYKISLLLLLSKYSNQVFRKTSYFYIPSYLRKLSKKVSI